MSPFVLVVLPTERAGNSRDGRITRLDRIAGIINPYPLWDSVATMVTLLYYSTQERIW
jgi:hypothetical protein